MNRPSKSRRGLASRTTGKEVAEAFREARDRTLGLVSSVTDDDLERVHSTLMSPLVCDLGHIAAFEDLWCSESAAPTARSSDFYAPCPAKCRSPADHPMCAAGRDIRCDGAQQWNLWYIGPVSQLWPFRNRGSGYNSTYVQRRPFRPATVLAS